MSARRDRTVRRFGTPAYRASLPGQPQRPSQYSQAELRERRRRGLTIGHYGGDWSLAAEIAAVVGPLADRVAAADRPARFRHCATEGSVPTVVEAVHEAVGVIVGWLAEAEARRRTKHLANEPGKRRNAITAFCDLATRPALPEVTDEALASGAWAGELVSMAEGHDAAFSELLSRAYPPEAEGLRGQVSRSERLDRLLRDTIDRAALALTRRLDRDETGYRRPTAQTKADQARAELAALGITT